MKLVDLTGIATSDLPIADLRAHLRLGTGFSDDTVQEPVLEPALRAAVAAIEARTGKVLFERGFRWSLPAWRSPARQALPVAPVAAVTSLNTVTRTGDVTAVDLDTVALEQDDHRPVLHAVRGCLPAIPLHGVAEVTFLAGYALTWAQMPAALAQAVLLLAAHFYETRHDDGHHDGNMPFAVAGLISRFRTVRILGGAGA